MSFVECVAELAGVG